MSKVELISLTPDAEKTMAYIARVSNPKNQKNEDYSKLLSYCIKNEHWSPFEMVSVQMSITTTRDISRQIIRHRSFSFQEFSQRYAEAPDQTYNREARLQDPSNRQNSIEIDNDSTQVDWKKLQEHVGMESRQAYNEALKMGIAKEQARALLPEGLTETTVIVSGSLRSWIHYCQLRKANGTQKEHREIADRCWSIITGHFPSLANIFE